MIKYSSLLSFLKSKLPVQCVSHKQTCSDKVSQVSETLWVILISCDCNMTYIMLRSVCVLKEWLQRKLQVYKCRAFRNHGNNIFGPFICLYTSYLSSLTFESCTNSKS